MAKRESYAEKFPRIARQAAFERLPPDQHAFLRRLSQKYRFSYQELRQLSEIANDLNQWGEPSIIEAWPSATPASGLHGKEQRAAIIGTLRLHADRLRAKPKEYCVQVAPVAWGQYRIRSSARESAGLGLGRCPVASERTRCCNLLTLDAVENCGFGCSYCSIQSFYHDDEIHFDERFAEKLSALKLDPRRIYHIGTGQSSDSLMWGNRFGVLDALTDFARRHPNVILELKTKSKNVSYFLKNEVPRNLICTWSLNPPAIVNNEEHRTAPLADRIEAARLLADRGVLVGFHVHPMVHYADWEKDYSELLARVEDRFDPAEVALVSFGTLTFTKSVVRQIRNSGLRTRILQMPLTESDGKLSYPEEVKLHMFSHAYSGLASWHGRVFFYLCMENQRLWRPVFGFDYPSNEAFEDAMKESYLQKIHPRAKDNETFPYGPGGANKRSEAKQKPR
jgi:spore photoproduct lyase